MVTWAEYVDEILNNELRDINNTTWTPGQVYTLIGWALDTFCSHTALLKETTYETGDTGPNGAIDMETETQFFVPDDAFEKLQQASQVYSVGVDDIVTNYDPLSTTPGLHINDQTENSFYVWPENVLTLNAAPGADSVLHIRYFAYYARPVIDTDDAVSLPIPRWAHKPVATLVAAYAMESLGVESANIDRWKDKSDSGNPEHNALRKQQEFLIRQYEYQISKFRSQDRANFFREYGRSGTDSDYFQRWGAD